MTPLKFNMNDSPISARCDKDEETIIGHIIFYRHTAKSKENLKNDKIKTILIKTFI